MDFLPSSGVKYGEDEQVLGNHLDIWIFIVLFQGNRMRREIKFEQFIVSDKPKRFEMYTTRNCKSD